MKLMRVTVDLNGRSFLALVDTGASVNAVGEEALNWFRERGIQKKPASHVIVDASKNLSTTDGSYEVETSIQNRRCIIEYCYLPNLSEDVILGVAAIINLEWTLISVANSLRIIDRTGEVLQTQSFQDVTYPAQSQSEARLCNVPTRKKTNCSSSEELLREFTRHE